MTDEEIEKLADSLRESVLQHMRRLKELGVEFGFNWERNVRSWPDLESGCMRNEPGYTLRIAIGPGASAESS